MHPTRIFPGELTALDFIQKQLELRRNHQLQDMRKCPSPSPSSTPQASPCHSDSESEIFEFEDKDLKKQKKTPTPLCKRNVTWEKETSSNPPRQMYSEKFP